MAIVARKEDSDYSPSWKWRDEEELEGRHVEFRRAPTESCEKVVWELDTDAFGRVSVWLDLTNLVIKVQAELARRKAKRGEPRLEVGERVRINPGTKRPSKRTPGNTVWPFPVVWFENGLPDASPEDFLLAGTVESDNGEVLDEAAANAEIPETDDAIPF